MQQTKDKKQHIYLKYVLLVKKIENQLKNILFKNTKSNLVEQAMFEGTLSPGKRIRPILFILINQDLGFFNLNKIINIACVIEIIHSASLILDDLPCMDNSHYRRGYKSIHIIFGEEVALLASIALINKAFNIIANLNNISEYIKNKIISELSWTISSSQLIHGQLQDLLKKKKNNKLNNSNKNINKLKTSTMFCLIIKMIAIIFKIPNVIFQKLNFFLLNLGILFQEIDDINDNIKLYLNNNHLKEKQINIIKNKIMFNFNSLIKHLLNINLKHHNTLNFIKFWFQKQITFI